MRVALAIISILALGGGYYYFLYPPKVMQRRVQASLDDFSKAVATQDRAQVGAALQRLLADNAHIKLEVGFYSIAQPGGSPMMTQAFDKANFMTFVDNILFSLEEYSYRARVKEFRLSPDKKTAAVTFVSNELADGKSWFAGTPVNMRFSGDTTCKGEVSFESAAPTLTDAVCKMQLSSVPKPGQENTLQNRDTLRELLR